jgi:hypothetical protein
MDRDKRLSRGRGTHNLQFAGDDHKGGYGASPCSTSTSPGCIARMRPCVAMRRICAGVSVGNTCSVRELLSGNPRLTWLIMVVGGAAALANYLSDFSLNISGAGGNGRRCKSPVLP